MPLIFKQTGLLFSIGVLALIGLGAGYCYWKKSNSPTSLVQILDHYHITTAAQKKALEDLMKISGILKSTESLSTLFPSRSHSKDLFNDILRFVEITQQYFTIRTGTQERWEVKPTEWMEKNQKEVLEALETLNVTKKIAPTLKNPDVICILGARTSVMANRLAYAGSLFHNNEVQGKYLVLLAGQRAVTVGIDGTERELNMLANQYNVKLADLTETHMMRESYQNSSLFNQLTTEIIDTPKGNLPRPTTETTLLEFCKWLQQHQDVKTVTFVSSQPHVLYQTGVIKEVLRQQGISLHFEVIGSEISPSVKIQELVGALGSQIWSMTPNVLRQIKCKPSDEASRQAFLKLYNKNPLIYKNVEALLGEDNSSRSDSTNRGI